MSKEAQEFYDKELSKYNLLNLIDPATAKQVMEIMEEYAQSKPVSDAIRLKIEEVKADKKTSQDFYVRCMDECEKLIIANVNTEKSIQIRDLEDLLKISAV